MKRNFTLLDRFRRGSGAAQAHLVDGLIAGGVSRRDFLRHGSVLGLSLTTMGALLGAVGYDAVRGVARATTPTPLLRVAMTVPAGAIDPVKVADAGGLTLLQQCGEFLTLSGSDLVLRPGLATKWTPNTDGTVWTFEIRQGVKFSNGADMKADDVVASIERLINPDNASNALSAFRGVLSQGNVKKVDDYTVAFTLDAPNGNFPYIVSSDNYNAIILPADYKGDYESTFIGTGPFVLEKYTPKVGASFRRNDAYWGEKALAERVEFTFYDDAQPQVLALQGGQVDIIKQLQVLAAMPLMNDPNVTVMSIPSAGHQQIHMRTDSPEFSDKRVRQAMALSLDRDLLVAGLMRGRAKVGNDSPFAPAFPSTDTTVPQRAKDVAKAKELLAAAGKTGLRAPLIAERYLEIPEYAVLMQNAAREIGVELDLQVQDQATYYGEAVFGKSNWLDATMGITTYGHRGVPNVYLSAPLLSDGTWNSARFKNADYDRLAKAYVAALDLESQRKAARDIQLLLLDETPVIFGYFYDSLTPTAKGVTGVQPTAMSQLFLGSATKA
jgi:peptide/nickel transport system substrate-binding protein